MDSLRASISSSAINGFLLYYGDHMPRDHGTVSSAKDYASNAVPLLSMDDFRNIFRLS